MRFFLQLFLLLTYIPCNSYSRGFKNLPERFEARVVRVWDGDTFDAVYKDSTYRFRLFDIDAPEYGQEYYDESKQLLFDLSFAKYVVIDYKGEDRYGRILGIIYRKVDTLNINREIVKEGFAWNYTHYSTDTVMPKLESYARAKHIGIWSSPYYLEPWEYRKSH